MAKTILVDGVVFVMADKAFWDYLNKVAEEGSADLNDFLTENGNKGEALDLSDLDSDRANELLAERKGAEETAKLERERKAAKKMLEKLEAKKAELEAKLAGAKAEIEDEDGEEELAANG